MIHRQSDSNLCAEVNRLLLIDFLQNAEIPRGKQNVAKTGGNILKKFTVVVLFIPFVFNNQISIIFSAC